MLLRSRRLPPAGFIEPYLPSPAERPPIGPGWIHEIKLNGFRRVEMPLLIAKLMMKDADHA